MSEYDRLWHIMAGASGLQVAWFDCLARGWFVPTDHSDDCKWCDYKAVCRVTVNPFNNVESPPAGWAKANAETIREFGLLHLMRDLESCGLARKGLFLAWVIRGGSPSIGRRRIVRGQTYTDWMVDALENLTGAANDLGGVRGSVARQGIRMVVWALTPYAEQVDEEFEATRGHEKMKQDVLEVARMIVAQAEHRDPKE